MAFTNARSIRPAAVAGLFYPADPGELTARIEALLDEPRSRLAAETLRCPRALVVPHAGYEYSGPIAASAYRRLGRTGDLRRIVLLGPSHYQTFRGMAVPTATAFATPLGPVGVDDTALRELCELPSVVAADSAHAREHSLEVQLPFLQHFFAEVPIVPIVTGSASAAEVQTVIDALWDERTLIIISSDLSHYHPYEAARALDENTARAILEGREDLCGAQACGCVALNGLARAARRRGLDPELIDLRNSGDTSHERRRVVGYGAFGFHDA